MRITRRALAATIAVGATLLAAGGIAWAAIPDSSGAVNACYAALGGALRAVDGPGDCGAGETAVPLGGPTRGYAFANPGSVALGSTSVVVGSLKLGPGKYLVHGKVNVANLNFSALRGTFVPCSLKVGGTTTNLDQTWLILEQALTGSAASNASFALQAAVELPAGGSIVMECASLPRPGGPPTGVVARYRQLDAIGVDALSTTF
jgi:hypothetical protein